MLVSEYKINYSNFSFCYLLVKRGKLFLLIHNIDGQMLRAKNVSLRLDFSFFKPYDNIPSYNMNLLSCVKGIRGI